MLPHTTEAVIKRRERLKAERRPSELTGEQHCNRCGVCCLMGPCQLNGMGDVERMAAHLNLSVRECIELHLVEEPHPMGGTTVVARRNADRSCHLYDDAARACTIEAAKPEGGRQFECWSFAGLHMPPFLWSQAQLTALRSARGV